MTPNQMLASGGCVDVYTEQDLRESSRAWVEDTQPKERQRQAINEQKLFHQFSIEATR